jgi:hypothetical protein
VLDISEMNGKPIVTQHSSKKPAAIVCLDHNSTTLRWYERSAAAKFVIEFAPYDHTPLPSTVLVGGVNRPDGDDVTGEATGCYSYSVRHCIAGKPCTSADPKIIVQGTGIGDH